MATKKKETFNQALKKYEKSPQDKAEDAKNARKMMKKDNAKKAKK